MVTRMRAVVVGLLLLQFPNTSLYALETSDAEVVSYGLYTDKAQGLAVAPGSPAGLLEFSIGGEGPTLQRETDRVPARLGVNFGFAYIVHGKPAGQRIPVRIVYRFPEMTNPKDGKTWSSCEIQSVTCLECPGAAARWHFTEPWEIVPGKWTFQVFHKDRLLLEKTFTVVREE